MKYCYRVAAVILFLIFTGHTVGAMILQNSLGPLADAVFAQMKSVHFDFNGSERSYYDIYMGFGLTVSAFLLLSSIMAWQLTKVTPEQWPAVSVIAWALFAANVANAVLACMYFFIAPMIMGTLAAALLGAGTFLQERLARAR